MDIKKRIDELRSFDSSGFVGSNGATELMRAAALDDAVGMRLLLALGASQDDRDKQGLTAVDHARHAGHHDAAALLALARDPEYLRALAEQALGAPALAARSKALLDAIDTGYPTIVAGLSAAGVVDVDARDRDGATPLMRAAMSDAPGAKSCYLALLMAKCDPLAKDNEGRTARDYARRNPLFASLSGLGEPSSALASALSSRRAQRAEAAPLQCPTVAPKA